MFTRSQDEEAWMFVLRLAARVSSVLVFGVIILFYIGEGVVLSNIHPREIIGQAFFPFGLLIGFAVGCYKELAGGIAAICSTIAFYLVYGLILSGTVRQGWAFLVFTIPGVLFLLYGLLRLPHAHSTGRKAII